MNDRGRHQRALRARRSPTPAIETGHRLRTPKRNKDEYGAAGRLLAAFQYGLGHRSIALLSGAARTRRRRELKKNYLKTGYRSGRGRRRNQCCAAGRHTSPPIRPLGPIPTLFEYGLTAEKHPSDRNTRIPDRPMFEVRRIATLQRQWWRQLQRRDRASICHARAEKMRKAVQVRVRGVFEVAKLALAPNFREARPSCGAFHVKGTVNAGNSERIRRRGGGAGE